MGRENLAVTSPVSISYHRTGILRDGMYAKMVPCQLKDHPQLPQKIKILAKGGTFDGVRSCKTEIDCVSERIGALFVLTLGGFLPFMFAHFLRI